MVVLSAFHGKRAYVSDRFSFQLHVAGEQGHLKMVNLLLSKCPPSVKLSPPVDLVGRTPLAVALKSPEPSARKQKKDLSDALFSPGDVSIFGNPLPVEERLFVDEDLGLSFGIADMPGRRIDMEDAICQGQLLLANEKHHLVAVFDGHADGGLVSKYLADNIIGALEAKGHEIADLKNKISMRQAWESGCLDLDARLREEGLSGGSTACMALISKQQIVVANVGDSRAIMVQTNRRVRTTQLDASENIASHQQSQSNPSCPEDTPRGINSESKEDDLLLTTVACGTDCTTVVIPLSHDHKPDVELEKARAEAAGLAIFEETFVENGEPVTIHKISISEKNRVAFSRSFGDFDYKANASLPPEKQAVIAVPELRFHDRSPDNDRFLIVCCDGVFDVMTNEEVGQFVVDQASLNKPLPVIGDNLVRTCFERGSGDNMSVIIVALGQAGAGDLALTRTTLNFSTPTK
jgi:serine/threonine protein phosphatase PrpC